jgi:hypothetical protein
VPLPEARLVLQSVRQVVMGRRLARGSIRSDREALGITRDKQEVMIHREMPIMVQQVVGCFRNRYCSERRGLFRDLIQKIKVIFMILALAVTVISHGIRKILLKE